MINFVTTSTRSEVEISKEGSLILASNKAKNSVLISFTNTAILAGALNLIQSSTTINSYSWCTVISSKSNTKFEKNYYN